MLLPTIVTLLSALYLVASASDAVYQKKDTAAIRVRGNGGGQNGNHGSSRKHCRPHDHHNITEILLEHHAQAFCSTFLHLPATVTATTTATTSATLATATVTSTFTSDPGTTTETTTITDTTSVTDTITDSETTTQTSISTTTTTTTVTVNSGGMRKRDLPPWLPFPTSAISSACSRIVTPTTTSVTATATVTDTLTATETTTASTTLPLVTDTSSITTTDTETTSVTETTSFTVSTTVTTTATATTTVTAACFSCPPQDEASFALGTHSDDGTTLFCSYPAFPGEDPNDFYCKYSDATGIITQDNDAGFCPGVAVNNCAARKRDVEGRAAQPLTSRAKMAARSGMTKMKKAI